VAELDQDRAGVNTGEGGSADNAAPNLFIQIQSMPRIAHGRDLRLSENDVIAAVNGEAFHGDVDSFNQICREAEAKDRPVLLTICRNTIIYDVFASRALGVQLDYADAPVTSAAEALLAAHHLSPKDQYQTYEALRDVRRHVVIYDTCYSALATIAPPLWLIQNRAWEPLAAVVAVYGTAAAINIYLFGIVTLLLAVYFHRIQFRMIRNYNLFTEHHYWLVFAARSPAEAQMICRRFDQKCRFDFSYVGPPAIDGAAEAT